MAQIVFQMNNYTSYSIFKLVYHFAGMLHSVKTEDVLKHRGYIAEVGLKLGREQSEKVHCQNGIY